MRHILSKPHLSVLESFAWSNALLALDFDGTLAPIHKDPASASMRERTHRLLKEAGGLYPTAVISGRARQDVSDRVSDANVAHVIGNHGLEPSSSTSACAKIVRTWRPLIADLVDAQPGLVLEDKAFSVAIHYRQSRQRKAARAAIAELASRLSDVRVIEGKLVVNLVPIGAPHKGIALRRVQSQLGCDTAIYVGDDETDEDVFSLSGARSQLLSIRIGKNTTSAAEYFLKQQREMDQLLSTLCRLRQHLGRRAPA